MPVKLHPALLVQFLLSLVGPAAFSQEMMAIPKARLEELEQKEMENAVTKAVAVVAAAPTETVVTHVSAVMAALNLSGRPAAE